MVRGMTGRPVATEPSTVFSGYTLATLMPTKLEEIVAATRERVAVAKASADLPGAEPGGAAAISRAGFAKVCEGWPSQALR